MPTPPPATADHNRAASVATLMHRTARRRHPRADHAKPSNNICGKRTKCEQRTAPSTHTHTIFELYTCPATSSSLLDALSDNGRDRMPDGCVEAIVCELSLQSRHRRTIVARKGELAEGACMADGLPSIWKLSSATTGIVISRTGNRVRRTLALTHFPPDRDGRASVAPLGLITHTPTHIW